MAFFCNHFSIKHMKNLLIAAAVAATFVTPQAFAQAKNFEGFSVSAGTMTLSSSYTGTVGSTVSTGSATDTQLGVQGQYAWALGDSFVLAAGAQVGLGQFKADAGDGKIKNVATIYIAPGIAVSKDVLIYGKLGATSYDFSNPNGGYSNSAAAYGVGVQVFFSKNVFFQGEYLASKPADKNFNGWNVVTDKVGITNLSVGYKF
jgi:outer membrane immunogenic protein